MYVDTKTIGEFVYKMYVDTKTIGEFIYKMYVDTKTIGELCPHTFYIQTHQ
jgi:hypothetical protein